ncbi:hypothetical protein MesoLjLc_18540 [Mesorhizobium sp. L-8-10]|uniref:bacteriocin fulvocin C-related protein n=1 Tax=Mesorhizobium sp. L-8-10 TaxID=2744523 RepID=UPI0019271F21|nr:bacteriocin fulvocin C-related protein [Mesorhizobium sp. L-8-10]BCH29924.1 hypothetical protein MesoLjLc_18540 [Mesorhizobium sp. L-8-10]
MLDISDYLTTFRNGLAALSLGEQKLIFDGLPAAYQAALWQDRLREGIEAVYDKGQKATLSDLAERLRPESYSDPKKNKAAVAYIDKLAPRLEKLFPDFTLLQKYTQYLGDGACKSPVIMQAGGALPACECRSADSGLLRGNPCGALIQCRAGGCTPVRGCGFFWLQICDGLCTGQFGP